MLKQSGLMYENGSVLVCEDNLHSNKQEAGKRPCRRRCKEMSKPSDIESEFRILSMKRYIYIFFFFLSGR